MKEWQIFQDQKHFHSLSKQKLVNKSNRKTNMNQNDLKDKLKFIPYIF